MDRKRLPQLVVSAAFVVLLAAWLAVYAVDGAAWFGRPPVIGETPIYLWQILFPNGPIEWLQWIGLAAGAVLSTYLGGRLRERDPNGDGWRFWTLFGVGLAIMLLEDAGDMRHIIVAWATNAFGSEIGPLPTRYVLELPYLAAMVSVLVYAVLRYGGVVFRPTRTRRYLVSGLVFYTFAAISHVPVFDFKERAGAFMNSLMAGGQMAIPEDRTLTSLHTALADGPIEETLELAAVACLLAMAVAFWAEKFPRLTGREAGPQPEADGAEQAALPEDAPRPRRGSTQS